ncbi:hypothetical protein AXG93_1052s1360 [Marchantia polymorpha subsp. ruderalis]|uniref:CCHC-type domain-containing protein n=1 Tax=Marchantia polymorpha subsp. ruderalis TaxID=1480154 RepID=A0A176VV70_MARPO|nr:hypothetical protein AXG93_1052s1360 [Marchantia polymorpha subsp. ruderalis]
MLNNAMEREIQPLIARYRIAADVWQEYETFVRSMQVTETLSTQTVITNLLLEEEHLKKSAVTNGTTALYIAKKKGLNPPKQQPRRSDDADTSSSARLEYTAKPSFPRQKMKCFYCKKRGHLASECHKKKQESSSSHSTANAEHRLFVTVLSSTSADPTWYLDSGATKHMAYSRSAFVNYKELPSEEFIYLGDESRQPILGKGSVLISLNDGTDRVLPDMLHVPALRKNLFSVTQHIRQGGGVVLKHDHCIVQDKMGETIVRCTIENELIRLGT